MGLTKGDLVLYPNGSAGGIAGGMSSHYAVYIGNGEIVEVAEAYAGAGSSNTEVLRVRLRNDYNSYEAPENTTRDECVRRALSQVGRKWNFDLLYNNCESFARWCGGEGYVSYQGDNVWKAETAAKFAGPQMLWAWVAHRNKPSDYKDSNTYDNGILVQGSRSCPRYLS